MHVAIPRVSEVVQMGFTKPGRNMEKSPLRWIVVDRWRTMGSMIIRRLFIQLWQRDLEGKSDLMQYCYQYTRCSFATGQAARDTITSRRIYILWTLGYVHLYSRLLFFCLYYCFFFCLWRLWYNTRTRDRFLTQISLRKRNVFIVMLSLQCFILITLNTFSILLISNTCTAPSRYRSTVQSAFG